MNLNKQDKARFDESPSYEAMFNEETIGLTFILFGFFPEIGHWVLSSRE